MFDYTPITQHNQARSGYANPDSVLTPEQIEDKKTVILEFENFTRRLEQLCPAGRDLSLVKTKLEEACYFAKQSIRNV